MNWKKYLSVAIAVLAIGAPAWSQNVVLTPELQQVIKLSQAHMTDDVILNYIKSSGATYNLGANEILYLNSQGVSQPVIAAMLQARSGASPAPVAPEPPPSPSSTDQPPANFDYFQTQLSPYGQWIDDPESGACWVPADAANPEWRPYFDQGHWDYTDAGLYWQSDYPWGAIAFHYGRWHRNPRYGWTWVPGYDWAPSWVCWRHAEDRGFCGWAPLPPEARFELGVGLMFHGHLALDIDFGLVADDFAFVEFGHFWEHDFHRFMIEEWRRPMIFRSSVVINNYRISNGRFMVEGLGRARLAELTHHEIKVVAAHDLRATEEHKAIVRREDDIRHGVVHEPEHFHAGTAPEGHALHPESKAQFENKGEPTHSGASPYGEHPGGASGKTPTSGNNPLHPQPAKQPPRQPSGSQGNGGKDVNQKN